MDLKLKGTYNIRLKETKIKEPGSKNTLEKWKISLENSGKMILKIISVNPGLGQWRGYERGEWAWRAE